MATGDDRVRFGAMRWIPLALLLSCAAPSAQTPLAQTPAQPTIEVPAHTQAMIDAYRTATTKPVAKPTAPRCPSEDSTEQLRQKYLHAVGGCVEAPEQGDFSLDVAPRAKWPALYAALDAQRPAVERCIQEGRPYYGMFGKLGTRLELAADGTVKAVRTVSDEASNPDIACCVRRELRRARLPAPGRPIALEFVVPYDVPSKKEGLSKEQLRPVVEAHSLEVRACYDAAAEKGLVHGGRLWVQFAIARDGTVANASVAEDDLGSPTAACCVVDKIRSWRFPAPKDGAPVTVIYPFLVLFGS